MAYILAYKENQDYLTNYLFPKISTNSKYPIIKPYEVLQLSSAEMSASRFFGSFGAPIFLSRHHYLAAPRPPIRFANPHRYCSSAVASDCAHAFPFSSENPANAWNHPWPEWASFVDCLKTKGYLTESRTASSPGDIASEGNGNVFAYADRNILKNACLNFGRDRFDILK